MSTATQRLDRVRLASISARVVRRCEDLAAQRDALYLTCRELLRDHRFEESERNQDAACAIGRRIRELGVTRLRITRILNGHHVR
jgi:hypothetical protein